MSTHTYPIVGAFYCPPAKAICAALSVGTPLFLSAEPDNPYDPNAIAVWLLSREISESSLTALDTTLPDFGFDRTTLLAQDQWHLGYIPRQLATILKANGVVRDDEALDVAFTTLPSGAPAITYTSAD